MEPQATDKLTNWVAGLANAATVKTDNKVTVEGYGKLVTTIVVGVLVATIGFFAIKLIFKQLD